MQVTANCSLLRVSTSISFFLPFCLVVCATYYKKGLFYLIYGQKNLLLSGQLFDGHAVEYLYHLGLDLAPDGMDVALDAPFAGATVGQTPVGNDRPFDRLHHLAQGYARGGAADGEPTASAAERVDYPDLGEALEYLGEKALGSIGGLGNLADERYLARLLLGKVQDSPDRIFSLAGQLHHKVTFRTVLVFYTAASETCQQKIRLYQNCIRFDPCAMILPP